MTPGTILASHYRLDSLLGEGGMGIVWAATDLRTEERVAVKVLREQLRDRKEFPRRFAREARVTRILSHPNIVPILDELTVFGDGEHDGGEFPALVFPLLKGETLRQDLDKSGKYSLSKAATILRPVASAGAAAHAHGIIHRDLKPENIWLEFSDLGNPWVRVLDFGVAKVIGGAGLLVSGTGLTRSGTRLGTPAYMAPEQALGESEIGGQTDVWALGVVLYECLSGARPVEGANIGQVFRRLLEGAIMPIEYLVPSLPVDVAQLISAMLTRERIARPSMTEVEAVLARYV